MDFDVYRTKPHGTLSILNIFFLNCPDIYLSNWTKVLNWGSQFVETLVDCSIVIATSAEINEGFLINVNIKFIFQGKGQLVMEFHSLETWDDNTEVVIKKPDLFMGKSTMAPAVKNAAEHKNSRLGWRRQRGPKIAGSAHGGK